MNKESGGVERSRGQVPIEGLPVARRAQRLRRFARRRRMGAVLAVLGALSGAGPQTASAAVLPSFKDSLFGYPETTARSKDGALVDVPYSEARDIDARDEIPERRVKRSYVQILPGSATKDETLEAPGGALRWTRVGDVAGASAIVVFVHGRNGDRRLGQNDWSFGGNFNRLKNLLVRAGGAYATVDGGALGERDAARVGTLTQTLRKRAPQARIVLACGSMGGELCWTLMADRASAGSIDGLVLLGANSDAARLERLRTAAGRDVPLFLAHGTRDKVYPLDRQRAFFDGVRQRFPAYPIRMAVFEDGNHGTPIRMIDWRDTLNWMLAH